MKHWFLLILLASVFMVEHNLATAEQSSPLTPVPQILQNEWLDSATGHRVVRLSRLPGSSSSFYFHQNAYTSDKMVFANAQPRIGRRLYAIDLKTYNIQPVTDRDSTDEIVAAKRREIFYKSHGKICATKIDTRQTYIIAELPEEWKNESVGLAVNANETLLASFFVKGAKEMQRKVLRSQWFIKIFEAKPPSLIFTIQINTGSMNVIYRLNEWLGHVQFSPTDPTLLMFCHEGPPERLDRIWQIRTDGTDLRKIYERKMKKEIVVHEFWNPDGRIVWYDLHTQEKMHPERKEYFIGGTNILNGQTIRYPLSKEHWSFHYNISHDGKRFAGDGSPSGKWIYLYTPGNGSLHVERLCSLNMHDYKLEPNVTFTPDDKWVVFGSNMHGIDQVYAVEVAKTI